MWVIASLEIKEIANSSFHQITLPRMCRDRLDCRRRQAIVKKLVIKSGKCRLATPKKTFLHIWLASRSEDQENWGSSNWALARFWKIKYLTTCLRPWPITRAQASRKNLTSCFGTRTYKIYGILLMRTKTKSSKWMQTTMKTTIATYLTVTCRSFQIIRKSSFLSKTRNIKVKLTRIRNTNYSVSCWESFYLITGTLFRGTIMIQISTNLLRIVAMCRVRALFLIMLRNFYRNIS